MSGKVTNSYQRTLSNEFYEKIPKAVLAAIAVSFAVNHQGVDFDNVEETLLNEWKVLNANGTIPQKPLRKKNSTDDILFKKF